MSKSSIDDFPWIKDFHIRGVNLQECNRPLWYSSISCWAEVQGRAPTDRLVPLAIDCRPDRGLTNSCGITNGVCNDET